MCGPGALRTQSSRPRSHDLALDVPIHPASVIEEEHVLYEEQALIAGALSLIFRASRLELPSTWSRTMSTL